MKWSRNRRVETRVNRGVGHGGLAMPRSRGAVTGLILVLLGLWGALIPFVGPNLHFAYTPDTPWTWTAARGWLEVFPGVATVIGGLLLISSRDRATAMFGGWLAVLGGAWFIIGRSFSTALRIGDIGQPVAATDLRRALLEIAYFSGLGALIVFFGGGVLARLSVRLARDVEPIVGPPVDTSATSVPASESQTHPVTPQASPDAVTEEGVNPRVRGRGRGIIRRRRAGV
jgi:hypothetical protein